MSALVRVLPDSEALELLVEIQAVLDNLRRSRWEYVADETISDTFDTILDAWWRGVSIGTIRSHVHILTRRRRCDWYRRNGRGNRKRSRKPVPDTSARDERDRAEVRDALAVLDDRLRVVVVGVYRGDTWGEAARTVGLPEYRIPALRAAARAALGPALLP